jgi:hypothetical protein
MFITKHVFCVNVVADVAMSFADINYYRSEIMELTQVRNCQSYRRRRPSDVLPGTTYSCQSRDTVCWPIHQKSLKRLQAQRAHENALSLTQEFTK